VFLSSIQFSKTIAFSKNIRSEIMKNKIVELIMLTAELMALTNIATAVKSENRAAMPSF
jgi:hypothetical protein